MNKTDLIKKAIESIPKNRFSVADVARSVDASSALVNNTLKSLVERGKLRKIGSGRNISYARIENEVENKVEDIPVADRFEYIQKFTEMVGAGSLPSLLLTGQAGVGKTFTVINTLESMNLVEGDDYVVVKGHSSPMGLYMCLYHNNGKIIVYDDADSIWQDTSALNILKGALDSYSRRTISWQSLAAERNGVPDVFEFTGQIIFISNKDARRLDSAVVSRTITCNLLMTNVEIVDRMDQLKADIENDIPLEMKEEVLCFLRDNADRFDGLSLRTFVQSLRIRKGCKDGGKWQNMILYTLSNS